MSRMQKGKTREAVDILVVNAEEMLTLSGSSQTPRTGKEMSELNIIRDGSLAIRAGKIVAVGKTRDVTKAFRGNQVLNAKGKTVMPGFVDPHTHLVFAGSGEDDFDKYAREASYSITVNSVEGTLKVARETMRTKTEKLVELGLERLDAMLAHGTTTAEAKSGYGLNTEEELRHLEAMRSINQMHSINVVPTYMGGCFSPSEYLANAEEFVDSVTEEALPKVAEGGLAEFCDVFCERGACNLEQTKRILKKAKILGLKLKLHADHLSSLGGAEAAASLGATSADHLNFSSTEGLQAMAQKGVAGVLLPSATFNSMMTKYPDARFMIDSGMPVALGTGFNSGNWCLNMQLVVALSCRLLRMTPAEAIVAATINAAHAIRRGAEVGSLEVGKRADVNVLNSSNHKFLAYSFGVNLVDKVIANGRLVVDREKQDEPVFMSKTE